MHCFALRGAVVTKIYAGSYWLLSSQRILQLQGMSLQGNSLSIEIGRARDDIDGPTAKALFRIWELNTPSKPYFLITAIQINRNTVIIVQPINATPCTENPLWETVRSSFWEWRILFIFCRRQLKVGLFGSKFLTCSIV